MQNKEELVPQKGKMGVTQISLFTMCAVIVLETLTASASIGPGGLFWWAVTFVLFVIPYALITSELGTTYPAEGGIYVWIRKAFGARMSTRAVYLYWLAGGLWMPAGYVLFAGIFSSTFMPDLSLNGQVIIILVMSWLTIAFINYKVDVGIWLTILGAIFKISVILILGIAGFYKLFTHGIANEFSMATMMPSADAKGIGFLCVIIYNLIGLELVACMGKQLKNPVKDIPKAILLSSLAISFLYIFGSMGILLALPLSELNLVSGIVDALIPMFGKGNTLIWIVSIFFMLSIIGNQATWAMAPSMAVSEAAKEGEMPAFLGKIHPRYHTPYWANRVLGTVATAVTLVYAWFAAGDNANMFWSVFAFSSTVIVISFLLFFASFIKLRISDPDTLRPFRVPGGLAAAWACSLSCIFFILCAAVLFVFPDILGGKINWEYSAPILSGVVLVLIIGEIIIRKAESAAHKLVTKEQIAAIN